MVKAKKRPASLYVGNTKRCSQCRVYKTFENFFKLKRGIPPNLSPECKECYKQYRSQQKVKERHNEVRRERRKKEPEKVRAANRRYINKWRKKAFKENPQMLKRHTIWRTMNYIMKYERPDPWVIDFIGCTKIELKSMLQSQFKPDMTWENYGFYGWHIDHITPLASFDLTDPLQFKKACHYTNLQPLWASENLRKSAKTE